MATKTVSPADSPLDQRVLPEPQPERSALCKPSESGQEGTRRAPAAPPLDTVLLWLTNTVERDFELRGVFPRLRRAHGMAFRGAATLHYLSDSEAAAVLADAEERARARLIPWRTWNAFREQFKNLQAAMKEAAERTAMFAGAEPVCVYKYDSQECWRGTKDQFKALGIQLAGPWPREPGGNRRFAKTRDSRGYKTFVTRSSPAWPDLYNAKISIPVEVWRQKQAEKPKGEEAARAKRRLATMFDSKDAFRAHVVDGMRQMVRFALDEASKPADWHGYTLDADALSEIHASFDAVAEAIVGARVNFDSALHAEIAQGHRAKIAAADTAFQAQFETLVRPNPRILEGGAQ